MNNEFEIEQSLLGGLMKLTNDQSDIANYVLNSLKPNSFFTRVHAEIYKSIKFLAASNMLFDQLSVASYLSKHSDVSIFEVDRCYSFHCDANLLRQYANTIKDSAIERYALSKINDLQDLISDTSNGNITQRIGLAESVVSGILGSIENRKSLGLRDGTEVANEWLDEIEDFCSGNVASFDLGIQGLDEIMAPKQIKPGSLVVVGARPKMGKTFFATKVACHYLLNRDQGVSIFSLEMRAADIWERMLSEKTKSNSNNFYTIPMENSAYWDTVGHDNVSLANTKIAIDDTPGTTIRHIKSEVRKQHRKHKQGLIIVDYLTLMESDEKAERNDLKYGEITKQLKMLAKELGCVVLLLTQLNRGLESRPDKRPFPADSRDTGQIEQDCDVWIGLYREKVYTEDVPYNFTEAIIRLNRPGASGTGYLTLENGYFEDVPTLEAQKEINGHNEKVKANDDEQSSQFSGKYKKRA
tara:strand:- start:467 stop:1873 length:1407 start_codon:yes stop_codon:yes gene_type:complete